MSCTAVEPWLLSQRRISHLHNVFSHLSEVMYMFGPGSGRFEKCLQTLGLLCRSCMFTFWQEGGENESGLTSIFWQRKWSECRGGRERGGEKAQGTDLFLKRRRCELENRRDPPQQVAPLSRSEQRHEKGFELEPDPWALWEYWRAEERRKKEKKWLEGRNVKENGGL